MIKKRLASRVDTTDVSIIIQFSLPNIKKINREKNGDDEIDDPRANTKCESIMTMLD